MRNAEFGIHEMRSNSPHSEFTIPHSAKQRRRRAVPPPWQDRLGAAHQNRSAGLLLGFLLSGFLLARFLRFLSGFLLGHRHCASPPHGLRSWLDQVRRYLRLLYTFKSLSRERLDRNRPQSEMDMMNALPMIASCQGQSVARFIVARHRHQNPVGSFDGE